MKLPLAGPTYEHSSKDVNFQRCVNLFPAPTGPISRDGEENGNFCLLSRAGYSLLSNLGDDPVRALTSFNGTLYVVTGNKMYKLVMNDDTNTATSTLIATIDSSAGTMQVAQSGTQLLFISGTNSSYIVDPLTDDVSTVQDVDFPTPADVVFLDGYFIVLNSEDATLHASGLNDGITWAALDVATAEAAPDRGVGLAVDKRELWIFGDTSVEIWYNSGAATGFPFARREGAFIDQGCASRDSILNFDNTLMWLDERGYVVKAEGYSPKVVSSAPINNAIKGYKIISDAKAYSILDRGHLFYVLTFPTAKKTWAYDATTGLWHERAYYNPNSHKMEADLAHNSQTYKNLQVVGSRKDGRVFLSDGEVYLDGDDPIHRIRTTAQYTDQNTMLNIPDLELHIETGRAALSAQDRIMMRYSNDGGYTWSSELQRSMGARGEYSRRIHWNRLGSAREWLFEFRVAANTPVSLIGLYVSPTQRRT